MSQLTSGGVAALFAGPAGQKRLAGIAAVLAAVRPCFVDF